MVDSSPMNPTSVAVSVDQLRAIHRDLDACQKVIWLAGVRPRGYGFDPAYCKDAQARLREIEVLIETAPIAQAEQPVQYTIGDLTYEKVFKAVGLTNLSDMQAVLDAVETAIAQAAPQPEQSELTGQCVIEVVSGQEGPSLYIGDGGISHRLSGNKPWAGGKTLHLFTVDIAELVREASALSARGGHHDR